MIVRLWLVYRRRHTAGPPVALLQMDAHEQSIDDLHSREILLHELQALPPRRHGELLVDQLARVYPLPKQELRTP